MIRPDLLELIQNTAGSFGVPWRLVYAIINVESRFEPYACRFEPLWNEKWVVTPDVFAKSLGQSIPTEIVQQKTSWGLMQVMGAVARELGFTGYLPQLCLSEYSIHYGCKKLQQLMKRYPTDINDVVAAYNAGSPRRQPDGRYVNDGYLIKVTNAVHETRSLADPAETSET